ncbi:hypothetical protein CQW23_29703 [Capsicum baccatum]|uniref:Ubiquitin-like protease family profile domain-containing protein n=1 Tax=Capsicum baccatum TaxID=33114 RepID=A0A2G2VCH1_CAPBA|nr:hypothetical protein CQW23_29703 [Capsicum baccatum]
MQDKDCTPVASKKATSMEIVELNQNLSTRESIVLPSPKFSVDWFTCLGMSFDSACGDYKILKIFHDKAPSEILALKSGPWRIIDEHPSDMIKMDCGLYMVTYAKCLTFDECVPSIGFDPDLIRRRYASLLWDYGSRKEETKAQSDDEAPMKTLRKIGITEDIEVHDH